MTINLMAYQAAQTGTIFYHQKEAGYLRLGGVDRVDFVQRQSTNDLHQLTDAHFVMTVLTTPTARILDVLCLIDEGDTLGVIPLPGRQDETAQFLRKRIFFSDQVALENISSDLAQILLSGPQAKVTLQNLGIQPPQPNSYSKVSWNNYAITVIAQEILTGYDFRLISTPAFTEAIQPALLQAGAVSVDHETYDILRVEWGRPGPMGELVTDFTPLEIGYQGMISDAKGCYTGQEIIARQMTYDKVAKKLVGLKLDRRIRAGVSLLRDGKAVGQLTSLVESPRFGVIGLGVLRRKFCDVGVKLTAEDAGSIVATEVVGLPFSA